MSAPPGPLGRRLPRGRFRRQRRRRRFTSGSGRARSCAIAAERERRRRRRRRDPTWGWGRGEKNEARPLRSSPPSPPTPPAGQTPIAPAASLPRPKMGKSRTQNGAGRLTAAHARRVPRAAAAAGRRPRLPPPPSLPLVPAPPRLQETARTNQTPPLFFRSFGLDQSPRTELHPDPALTNQPRETLTSLQPPPIGLRSNQKSPWLYLRRRLANALCQLPCDQWGCCPRRPIRAGQSPRGVRRGPMGVQAGQILLNSLLLGW